MKSPKLSLQFSRFQPQRTDQSFGSHQLKKKQNENLEDETNNPFVKFLRLSNETQINNQQCLFFDWYIMNFFFFSFSVGYILLLHTIPRSCQRHQNFHFLISNILNCTMNLKNPIMLLLSREYFFCSRRTLQASQ